MKNTSKTLLLFTRLILGAAAITFIIISIVTDKVTPYLAIGMGLTAITNIINCISGKQKKRFGCFGEPHAEEG